MISPKQNNPASIGTAAAEFQKDFQKELDGLLGMANLARAADGSIIVKGSDVTGVDAIAAAQGIALGDGAEVLPPPPLPKVDFSEDMIDGLENFAGNVGKAIDDYVMKPAGEIAGKAQAGLMDLSSMAMITAFLKLNINDPNNNPETHGALYEMATNLRQQAIDVARKKSADANVMMKEAQEYAENVEMFGQISTGAMIAVTIGLSVATFGVGAGIFVVAAMAAGAVVGAATSESEDGALQGAALAASVASMVYGIGIMNMGLQSVVKGSIEAAKSTAKGAADDAVKKAVEEATKKATAKAQELFQQAGKEATKQMKTIQDEVRREVTKSVQEIMKKAPESSIKQLKSGTIDNIVDDIFTQQAKSLALKNPELAKELYSEGFKKGLSTKVQEEIAHMKIVRWLNYSRVGMQVGTEMGEGVIELQTAQKMAEARLEELGVNRFKHMTDMYQATVEFEQEIIRMLMESKNKVVEAALKMRQMKYSILSSMQQSLMGRKG
jgi:vacuolar-type H+-ATPase subunit H